MMNNRFRLLCLVVALLPMQVKADADQVYQQVLRTLQKEQLQQALGLVDQFLADYPEDPRAEQVRVLRVSALFDQKKYAEVIQRVPELLSQTEGVEQESLAYMQVGAYCFSQDYPKALQAAEQYAATWSDGGFREDVVYFKALSLARLGYFQQAKALFLPMQADDVTEFKYLDSAMYELALIDFRERSYEESVNRLKTLHTWVTDEVLEVQVNLLLGRSLGVLRKREEAAPFFEESYTLAQLYALPNLEQETLFYLVDFYGRETIAGEHNEQLELALPYYRALMSKYPESLYAAQVVTAALPALADAGELEEGLLQLDELVRSYCAKGRDEGLKLAVQQLVWKTLSTGETTKSLREANQALPASSYAAVKWYALIEVYRAGLRQSSTKWGQQLRFQAFIDEAFASLLLIAQDESIRVPSYVRSELGWWLLKGGSVELAKAQFRLAQQTHILSQKDAATVGELAAERVSEGGDGERCRAELESLVLRSVSNKSVEEAAMYQLCEVLKELGDWKRLGEVSKSYIYDKKFSENRARVYLLEGLAFENRGLNEDAIAVYTRIFATYMQKIEVTAEVVDRLTVLTWQRNGPGTVGEPKDRQVAYQLAHRYLGLIESLPKWRKDKPAVQVNLQNIQRNVELWEASGEVRSVADLLEDLRKERRGIR